LALICIPVVLAVAAIITAVVLFVTGPRRPMASKADCDRIEIGMTCAEVEHILGGPPGDYHTQPSIPPPLGIRYAHWYRWQGDCGMVFVRFEEDGRMRDKRHFDYMGQGQRSLIDRIMSR
jgi:hypothetical protein